MTYNLWPPRNGDGHHEIPDPRWQRVSVSTTDRFDGMVVSWTLGTSLYAELVNTKLYVAIETAAQTTGLPLVHPDRERREPRPLDAPKGELRGRAG